jgi:hypothetical protein
MVNQAKFTVKFPTPQDPEKHGNDLDHTYQALEYLREKGYIVDYHCEEMKEEVEPRSDLHAAQRLDE